MFVLLVDMLLYWNRFWTSAVCQSHVQTILVAGDNSVSCDVDTGWRTDVADYCAPGSPCRQVDTSYHIDSVVDAPAR